LAANTGDGRIPSVSVVFSSVPFTPGSFGAPYRDGRGIRMVTVINSLLLVLAIIMVFAGIYVLRGR
jgi:hypothetical protein